MNILQVVLSLECGGLEKQVIHLSRKLQDNGITTHIVCLAGAGELGPEAESKGLNVICLNKKHGLDLSLVWKLKKIIKQYNIDLVHTHNFAPLIYGGLAAKLSGVKAINTRHSRSNMTTNRFIWNTHQKVIAVSNDAKKELIKINPVKEDKVDVIYNAINLTEFVYNGNGTLKRELRNQLNLNQENHLIGIVARLCPEKDHKTLLAAFSEVLKDDGKAELLIIGDGPLKEDLIQFAQKLGISENVHFMGFRDDIPVILGSIDIFVLSSITEGISLTLLEAMAASKPIVATAVGGNPEVVVDGENGILVNKGDVQGMAKALNELLAHDEQAYQMGKAGRQRVEDVFCLDNMVSKYKSLYETTIR